MRIDCLSCGKSNQFLLPLWTSTTFKFNEDGSLSILHVKPLEILEEKITDNKSLREISCKECGSNEVDIYLTSMRIRMMMKYQPWRVYE